jgi:hypothetical protein
MPAMKVSRRTAAEGSGHTARVYVTEESHSGVVPMNRSNKDGKPSAESEEGRLLIKENTLPSSTYPTQSGSARVPRVEDVRTSGMLGRSSSEIRTGCANERPSGSVRGAPGNWCPYRDLTDPDRPILKSEMAFHGKAGRGQVRFFLFPPSFLAERGSERPGAVKGAFFAAPADP